MPVPRSRAIQPEQFTTFGQLLRFLRQRAGLTQRELSIAVGYSESQLSRLEQNQRAPDEAALAARFVPALRLETELDWAARLLALGAASRAAGHVELVAPAADAPLAPNNLPRELSHFIGREAEIDSCARLVKSSALVTLTGPGGIGKSRLSLEVAARVQTSFSDGVWLVELAPLADPALVPQAVAAGLGVPEQPSRPMLETLKTYLRGRKALIILDNCEHLIEACAQAAHALLRACPDLHLLATSREALRVAGEAVYVVPPLSTPDLQDLPVLENMREGEAVRLFVERAQLALPGFHLTHSNAQAVAEVCRSLDGMPLAIELAAARVKLMRVEQIASRLADRFQLLKGGARTALPRHQTLESLIDWSYDLLSEPERGLLRRLAVFARGWTLEAAEQVCADESNRIGTATVLDLLDALVSKSLVVVERRAGQEGRYHLLETIRQYALAKLAVSGEAAVTRRRHARFYRALAETAERLLPTADERWWLEQLVSEFDNFRTAVAWSQTTGGEAEEGLRLASALREFWFIRGPSSEGLGWLTAGLALPAKVPDTVRARALWKAGWLAVHLDDFPQAIRHLETAIQFSRGIGDRSSLAWALFSLGYAAWNRRDDERTRALLIESLAIFRDLGEALGMGDALVLRSMAARAIGEYEAARGHAVEALQLYQEMGYLTGIASATLQLANIERAQGQDARAAALYDRALATERELGTGIIILDVLYCQAELARKVGDYDRSKALVTEVLGISRERGLMHKIAQCLNTFGGLLVAQGQPEMGACLLGAGAALSESIGRRWPVAWQAQIERDIATARAKLDLATFEKAWAEGQAMPPEQAIELALRL